MTDEMNVDWFRVCIAINGFRARYGHWPTMIHLPNRVLEPLFKPATLAKINNKIKIIYDNAYFVTQDDQGNQYSFKMEGFVDGGDIDAREWLGVSPDINSLDEDTQPQKVAVEVETIEPPKQEQKKENGKKPRKEKKPREKKIREKKPKEKKPKEKKPRNRSAKRHPILVILYSEILLAVFAFLYMLLAFVLNFQGQCIVMGTLAPCTLVEYTYQMMYLVPGRIVNMATQYWYMALLLVILFPLVGLVLNNRKVKKTKTVEEQRLDNI